MNEKRSPSFYRKRSSLNSDSTNLNSFNSGTNKVIQTQKLISNKLLDHLYRSKEEEIKPSEKTFFNSSPEVCEKP